MSYIMQSSASFGIFITFAAYGAGRLCHRKLKASIFNPNIIAIALIIIFLMIFDIDYDTYNKSASYLTYLLTPATICLAVPLYEQFGLLKKNFAAVMLGIASGVLTSLVCVLAMSLIFDLNYAEYITLMPKSITTAIAIPVSEQFGGYTALTVTVVMITGLLGNASARAACRLFRIKDPIAKGVAIGTSSHAMGTAKAFEIGSTEGAMSSLSIGVSGILTVILSGLFAGLPVHFGLF